MPPDYVRNLNLNTQQVGVGNHCDSEKTTWAEQMQLACTYDKPRIKNGKYCETTAYHKNSVDTKWMLPTWLQPNPLLLF